MKHLILLLLLGVPLFSFGQDKDVYICRNGHVEFTSDAPLELITASSDDMTGVLDLNSRAFSMSVASASFVGFNSSLQQTHFNENFLESEQFPNSTFKGKIIEEIDLHTPGRHTVRAKGKLLIHGVEFDRIIRCRIDIRQERILVNASFTVFLDDHDITIPTILNKKIAEEISVETELAFSPE